MTSHPAGRSQAKPCHAKRRFTPAAGALSGRQYSLVVCSFALHLIKESWLPALLAQLGLISDCLLILTPHKRPELKAKWGWTLEGEFVFERVRARLYRFNG